MNKDQLERALGLFIKEYAARYDMGVIPAAAWTEKPCNDGLKWVSIPFPIEPRGQMSALVKTLTLEFTAWYDEFLWVDVRLSYEHHGGGSNGHSESYHVLAENNILDSLVYHGFVSDAQARFIAQQNRRLPMKPTKEEIHWAKTVLLTVNKATTIERLRAAHILKSR